MGITSGYTPKKRDHLTGVLHLPQPPSGNPGDNIVTIETNGTRSPLAQGANSAYNNELIMISSRRVSDNQTNEIITGAISAHIPNEVRNDDLSSNQNMATTMLAMHPDNSHLRGTMNLDSDNNLLPHIH